MLDQVCTQLFSFYRSKEVELQRFTLQFVPTLIYNYLSSVARGNLKSCRCIETLLIGTTFNIHNLFPKYFNKCTELQIMEQALMVIL